jgi:hypothetical protein
MKGACSTHAENEKGIFGFEISREETTLRTWSCTEILCEVVDSIIMARK